MHTNLRDLAAGALFVAIGSFFALSAFLNLSIGSAFSMGPGYFPILLGLILIGLGVAIAVTALTAPAAPLGPVSWRGVGLVTASIVFFALTVRGLGMAPSLGGATILAALSTDRNSPLVAILLSLCLTAFCILVFVVALRLPYPIIGPWLGG
jgi:Tripartite tricarboxylate transporter TctB family